jgi:hypothetical protein
MCWKLGIDCGAAKQMLENAGGGDKLHRVLFRQLQRSYQEEEQREKVLGSIGALAETSIAEAEAKAVLDSQQQAEEHAQALAVHARQLEIAMAEAEEAKTQRTSSVTTTTSSAAHRRKCGRGSMGRRVPSAGAGAGALSGAGAGAGAHAGAAPPRGGGRAAISVYPGPCVSPGSK